MENFQDKSIFNEEVLFTKTMFINYSQTKTIGNIVDIDKVDLPRYLIRANLLIKFLLVQSWTSNVKTQNDHFETFESKVRIDSKQTLFT